MSCERAGNLGIFLIYLTDEVKICRECKTSKFKTDAKEREALQLKYGKQLDKLKSVAEDERY